MSASLRDLEHAAQLHFIRALKAEQKAEDIQHALNLMLNLGFERFHTALTMEGLFTSLNWEPSGISRGPTRLIGWPRRGDQHATAESSSGEPCSLEDTSMHRHSTMPSSGPCQNTSSPGVS